MNQEQKTKDFFNKISEEYKDKYKEKSAFHAYFFNERLEKATIGIDFNYKNVLDIGSGTGDLYDYLARQFPDIRYYASDISEGMLQQSNVPSANKFVGNSYAINYPVETFDIIFMLGVTTYMPPAELSKTFEFIKSKLSDDGQAIITFTNKRSYDSKMHGLLKKPLQVLYNKKNKVITQDFTIYSYSVNEVMTLLQKWFRIEKIDFLNHTIFPFNFIFPGISLARAKRIKETLHTQAFLEKNSSDFVIRLRLR